MAGESVSFICLSIAKLWPFKFKEMNVYERPFQPYGNCGSESVNNFCHNLIAILFYERASQVVIKQLC